MTKLRVSIAALFVGAAPALAQLPIVDVPTSPDDPMAKSVGWVERAPESAATPKVGIPVTNYKTSQRRTRTPWHGREQQSGAAPDSSASQLNQQELGRLSPGPGVHPANTRLLRSSACYRAHDPATPFGKAGRNPCSLPDPRLGADPSGWKGIGQHDTEHAGAPPC